MNKVKYLFLSFLLLSVISCADVVEGGADDPDLENDEVMACRIDGERWASTNYGISSNINGFAKVIQANHKTGVLAFQGTFVTITLNEFEVGTYEFGIDDPIAKLEFSDDDFKIWNAINGSVKITAFDDVDNTISGTFGATVQFNSGDKPTKTIGLGVFEDIDLD